MMLSGLVAASLALSVPQVGAGYTAGYNWPYVGPYVLLDRSDQGAVTSGGAAAVSAGICMATDGAACPIAGFVIASAAFYITVNGYCPNYLAVYLTWPYAMRCSEDGF